MSNGIPRAAMIVLAAFVSTSCRSPTEPLRGEGAPVALTFSAGGFGAPTHSVELRGDTLVYRRREFFSPGIVDSAKVVPTAEQWRTFWVAVERAGVHRWKPEYRALGVVDGGGWTLRITAGSRTVQSSGSNAFADREGRQHDLEETAEYRILASTIGTLVGRPGAF